MTTPSFLFCGYLVQEPYLADRRFPGLSMATIQRDVVPELNRIRYEPVGPVHNLTRFLPTPPEAGRYPGYVVNGYAIDGRALAPELGLDGSTVFPSKYEYARYLTRQPDGLGVLGYEVVDEDLHPFSYIFASAYSPETIARHAAPLNALGLFADPAAASRFVHFIFEEDQSVGTIWQVWG